MESGRRDGGVPDRDAGTVFVGELVDEDDFGRMSGLFSAHWESDTDRSSVEGPEEVTLDEAIAWARERSSAILVQVGGGDAFYSAGERDLTYDGSDQDDPVPVLPWPTGGLEIAARPMCTPLDGSAQVVLWRVHVRDMPLDVWARVAERLAQDELVVRTEPATIPGETADVIVRGQGSRAVFLPLHRLIDRCLKDLDAGGGDIPFNMSMSSDDERVFD